MNHWDESFWIGLLYFCSRPPLEQASNEDVTSGGRLGMCLTFLHIRGVDDLAILSPLLPLPI